MLQPQFGECYDMLGLGFLLSEHLDVHWNTWAWLGWSWDLSWVARAYGGSRPRDHRYVQIVRVTGSALSSYLGLCAKFQHHVESLTEHPAVSRGFTT